MKKIIIERGNEFKVHDITIPMEEDIFQGIYDRAGDLKRQLSAYNDRLVRQNADPMVNETEFLNNTIAFCGERGQGKSTAMKRFVGILEKEEEENILALRMIDPTAMEMAHDIVDIIVSRMFEEFQNDKKNMDKEEELEFIKLFQRVHQNMSILKNAEKFIENEYQYKGSVQNLSDITDSMNMKRDIAALVGQYLKYKGKKLLVIPIDDLDMNLKDAYKMTEQLRKYFVIPKVIIVMAVNIEQLTMCVERELICSLSGLKESQRWKIGREARNMSNKYMEKLIPLSRRVALPDVRAIAEDRSNPVEILYREGTDKEKILFDSKSLGIEKGILKLIYQKTGLLFAAKEREIHPIVPHTLRELVNFVSLLGDMGENKRANLKELERYFCDVWLEGNLSDQQADAVRRFTRTQNHFLHQDAFVFLYDMMDMNGVSLSKVKTLRMAVRAARSKMNGEDPQLSNGDVMNCIRLLQKKMGSEAALLGMAVNMAFSIRMLKLKEAGAMEELYDFVGDDLFGFYRLIREEAGDGSSRISFSYSVQEFIEKYCDFKINQFSVSSVKEAAQQAGKLERLLDALVLIGSTSEFIAADGTKRAMVSDNSQVATRAVFNLNTVFRSALSKDRILEKLSIEKWGYDKDEARECVELRIYLTQDWMTCVCNMEIMMSLGQYVEQYRDIKTEASEQEYYMHFFQSVDKFMNQYDWRWEDSGVIDEKGSKEVPILGMDDLIDLTDIVLQMRGDGNRELTVKTGAETEDSEPKKMKIPPVSNSKWKISTLRKNIELLESYIDWKLQEKNSGNRGRHLMRNSLMSMISELQEKIDFWENEGHDAIGRALADEYNEIRSKALA